MAYSSHKGAVRFGASSADRLKSEFSDAPRNSENDPAPADRSEESLGAALGGTAQAAADALRQQATMFIGDVGHELNRTGEAQKERGVEAIRGLARAIDSAADELQSQSPLVARAVHEAARGVDGLSDNLSNRNFNELVDAGVRLARAQPAMFVVGSVAAGFALARFLRSSAHPQSGGFNSYEI